MTQIVWEVRIKGKNYGSGTSTNVTEASPHPFDEFVGQNLPDDFQGDVIRRKVYDAPKFAQDGWVPHMSQADYVQMYGGGA